MSDNLYRMRWLLAVVVLLAIGLRIYADLPDRIVYPTGSDQDFYYLPAARQFADEFVVLERSPIYSTWIGSIYLLVGKDLRRCFYIEKAISTISLALIIAWLATRLFDLRTGLLAGIWVLDAKYMTLESNGSHAFAGIFVAMSLIGLTLKNQAVRIPAALFGLFLAFEVRRELLVPFVAVVLYLAFERLRGRKLKPGDQANAPARWGYTGVFLGCAALMLALFYLRSSRPEPNYFKFLCFQQFSVTYVERNGLDAEFPEKWLAYDTLIPSSRFPDVRTPLDMIRQHSDAVIGNIVYNVKLDAQNIPAVPFGLERPSVLLVALLVVLLSYLCWPVYRGLDSWKSLPRETKRLIVVWAVALHLIIPVTTLLRVMARYNIPLLALQIPLLLLLMHLVIQRLHPAIWRRREAPHHG